MEPYYAGDEVRNLYGYNEQPDEVYIELQKSFPWVQRTDFFAISSPVFHTVLQENVISGMLPNPMTKVLFGDTAYLSARKFCMTSITSFLRKYSLSEPHPSWLPSFCKSLFKGTNHEEYGRPYPPLANTFEDYYFSGDPEQVEAHFNLEVKRGAYETWYGATLVNGEVVRVKQYCYDTQQLFSDWDVAYLIQVKREGRTDLL
jgi:hypothetical protein